jgi:DNA topoisomerase VI subunit A
MREKYIEKRFGVKAQEMVLIINKILAEYAADGYDLSLRQLYYQLVSRNVVENTERSYKNVGNIVSDGRLAGLIDWDIIKDRGREMIQNPHWLSPADILNTAATQYRIDRWDTQPRYVEVMVEKQALEGVLIPVCSDWDVPFTANKGYSSSSAMHEAGKRIYKRLRDEKDIIIIYLGDHDPSGIDMTRDVEERLRLFAECHIDDTITVNVRRVALNMSQIEEMRPPENPAKMTDSRAEAYVQRFGESSWELDAIEPKRLAQLVSSAIEQEVDKKAWKQSGIQQQAGRDYIAKMARDYKP